MYGSKSLHVDGGETRLQQHCWIAIWQWPRDRKTLPDSDVILVVVVAAAVCVLQTVNRRVERRQIVDQNSEVLSIFRLPA